MKSEEKKARTETVNYEMVGKTRFPGLPEKWWLWEEIRPIPKGHE